ncbi:MAG: SIS domain-containing protein [Clostridia bacterium]|nr:SIS domain-containing protein [Clostridia bacterium]
MMDAKVQKHIDLLIERYPSLSVCKAEIIKAYNVLEECYTNGNKLLIAGNGGSCADAEHIVGELMKGFKLKRGCPAQFAEKLKNIDNTRGAELAESLQGGLPAIALDGHQALNTAFINDVAGGGLLTYAQQVYGYGKAGDVLLGISTSGNSKNVMNATVVARALGIKVIGLTGANGGELATVADVAIKVPSTETYMIQELHLPVYHTLCLMLEEHFFG